MEYRSKGKGVKRKTYPLKQKKLMIAGKSGTINPALDAVQIVDNKSRKGVDNKEVEDTSEIDAED